MDHTAGAVLGGRRVCLMSDAGGAATFRCAYEASAALRDVSFPDAAFAACVTACGAEYVREVQVLACVDPGIAGIEQLTALTEVDMGTNQISDVARASSRPA
jgi:hypothetical protein